MMSAGTLTVSLGCPCLFGRYMSPWATDVGVGGGGNGGSEWGGPNSGGRNRVRWLVFDFEQVSSIIIIIVIIIIIMVIVIIIIMASTRTQMATCTSAGTQVRLRAGQIGAHLLSWCCI
jgi:hypothetical protein